jgi:hypothetical protein
MSSTPRRIEAFLPLPRQRDGWIGVGVMNSETDSKRDHV